MYLKEMLLEAFNGRESVLEAVLDTLREGLIAIGKIKNGINFSELSKMEVVGLDMIKDSIANLIAESQENKIIVPSLKTLKNEETTQETE